MRVFVVGATGVLGRQVLPRLVERGHSLAAVARHATDVTRLQRLGIDAYTGDILDAESLREPLRGCDVALHLATAIPAPGPHRDWSRNDRIRREGTRNLLTAAQEQGVRRYVQQSITFLYGDGGDQLVTEELPLMPNERIVSALEMEQSVRASSLEWAILRGGAFYGPGTGSEDAWRRDAEQGTLVAPGDGTALFSLIRVEYMARAVVLAAEAAPAGAIYNVVDDAPVRYGDLYRYVAAQMLAPEPSTGGPEVASLGCSNAAIRRALGWEPAWLSYRSGLA
ncbi:MAG TPA: NAD(P)-dependent oxidoreductase [Ktedonobacterales bacterium]|nr:NAD(P)-dependent oxidoreductase [Ktedonobacterales bacterium]